MEVKYTNEQLLHADTVVNNAIFGQVMIHEAGEVLHGKSLFVAGLVGAASRIEDIRKTASRLPEQDIILTNRDQR